MMKNKDERTMYIDIKHLQQYDQTFEVKETIINEYYRYEPFLNRALENFMKTKFNEWATNKRFYVSFENIDVVEK
jgi:DNA replicative helicase MCM subunit Mcm2 (Cdc46/Mcm family)